MEYQEFNVTKWDLACDLFNMAFHPLARGCVPVHVFVSGQISQTCYDVVG